MASSLLPGFGLCVCFLLLAHMNEVYGTGCQVLDVVYPVGSTWKERCRSCTCTASGTSCTGGPVCSLPYKPEHETQCAEWADKCCCKATGCKLSDGTIVDLDAPLPTDPAKPCESCKCAGGSNKKDCTLKICPTLTCPGPVTPPGKCCPECTGCVLANGTTVDIGDPLPIDPNRPCEQCYCGGGNTISYCKITTCPSLSCWPQTKPPGACCRVCAPKCPLPASVISDLDPSETGPYELGSFAQFKSKNPQEAYFCYCPSPGKEAICNKGPVTI